MAPLPACSLASGCCCRRWPGPGTRSCRRLRRRRWRAALWAKAALPTLTTSGPREGQVGDRPCGGETWVGFARLRSRMVLLRSLRFFRLRSWDDADQVGIAAALAVAVDGALRTWRTPRSTAIRVLATASSPSLCTWMPRTASRKALRASSVASAISLSRPPPLVSQSAGRQRRHKAPSGTAGRSWGCA